MNDPSTLLPFGTARRRYPLLLVAALAISLAACEKTGSQAEGASPKEALPTNQLQLTPQALANADLEIVAAGPAELEQALRVQGDVKLETERVASIVARVKGVVRDVRKKMGDEVRKGEVLMTIESKELATAKMAYFETEHKVEFAKKALRREKELLAKKITSKEAYLEKQHAVEEAELAHAGALQRLKVLGFSEGALHNLKEDLDRDMTRFALRAPFAGEIIKKNVTLGEALDEEKEVFIVADLSRVWVEAKVPVNKVAAMRKGQQVKVTSDKTERETEGTLVYIASMADRASRTVIIRVEIDNTDKAWKPGMFARLDFTGARAKVRVSVPADALHEIEGRPTVFVQVAAGRFEVRAVEVGARDAERVEISSGLAAGDRVAAKNSLSLKAEWLNQ